MLVVVFLTDTENDWILFCRFVEYLEQRQPADGDSGISVVFDSLVQRFLNVERYANDIRYVNYCIKCVSLIEILHSHNQSLFVAPTVKVSPEHVFMLSPGELLLRPHSAVQSRLQ